MSKEIHALKDRTGQIFWPATATDAVIHPNTRLSLTDHIERYNLTSDDLILTLQDGIDKLVELEIDQHLGVQLVIKTEDGLIEEWTYYNSEEEFTSPEGWRKGGEIDTTLDATSENPVQNKAVYQAIIDNEEITAAALTELEERTATVETLKADLVNGKVPVYQIPELPASLLPTSLDDVLEFGGIGNFPSTGSTGIIYVDTETNKLYRWKPGNNSNTPGSYIQLTTDLDIKSLVQPESSTPLEVGDSYDTAFGKLVKIIRDNEIVTAEALQDLNGRVTTSSADLSGKADLVDGKVPASQLPSFVDDVIEVGTYSSLPVEGESGKIYIVTDTNKSYRWSGSTYFEIAGGSEGPLIIEITFNGSEDDGSGNAVFEFRSMHDYTTGWSSLNVSREEIEDAIERGIDIYIKDSGEEDSYLVNKITRSSDYTTLYALSVDHDGLMCSYIIYRTSTQSLTACKGYYKFRDNVNQIKNSIVVLPGLVITSMLDPNATVNSDSYYALKVNSLFSTTGSARLYTEKELFDELVGSTRYSSDANLIRPILFFNGVDQVTSIINLIPLEPSNIDFSLYWNTSGQGITLKAEGEDNIYTVAISSDNNTTPLTVTTTPKTDLESIIEEGQRVTAAALNDLNTRVLQNRSDIDELEEVTSVSLNTLNERVEDLEDDVQGILDKENLIETTYLELKDLRDSGKLESGRFYRITDYQCTTSQGNTASAGHQFDIVVLALGKDTLSEDAWAMMHDTDVYDVTFVNGITKKCYLYEYNTNDGEWNIVDVDTLTGITGRHAGEGEDIIINESNKTATCADSSTDLNEENLQYNYFQNCNLSAWKLKYALEDTTIRRFSWSVPGFLGGEVLTASTYNERIQYFRRSADRTKTINGTIYYEWELVYQTNNTSYPYYYTASENPLNGEDLIWYAANQGGYTTVSGQVISVDVDKDFGGRGIIYYMKDEHENECSYDFKNILFKRWAGNTVNDYIDGLDSYGGSGDTVGYVHWLSSGSGSIWGINLPPNGSTYQPTYYYTFTKRVSVSNPNCKNIDNSLTSTDINNTSGSNGNSIKSRYLEGAITLNDIIILSGNYNKFGFNCYSITVAGGSNNEFGNGCYDIRMRASSYNKFGSRCLYIYLSSSSNNTFGTFCNYLKLNKNSTYNRLGDGCNNCYLGQYSAYCIFNNHCEYVNFNNRSYYRNITVESGNKYITLSCTSTTSSSQYYQNVTIAKGISGTYSNPKTISDSNVNQNYQTIYKPANCQEISV